MLVIGNPKKGTALMQANPAMALDLPFRIMATTSPGDQTWLSFTNPVKLAKAYHVGDPEQMDLLKRMGTALNKVCQKAVSPY